MEEGSTTNPLHALRRAQVAALGGADWLGEAACASKLGSSLQRRVSEEGDGDDEKETSRYSTAGPSEAFAQVALEWVVRHEEGLTSKEQAASILNFFVEMNTMDSTYTPSAERPRQCRKRWRRTPRRPSSLRMMDWTRRSSRTREASRGCLSLARRYLKGQS